MPLLSRPPPVRGAQPTYRGSRWRRLGARRERCRPCRKWSEAGWRSPQLRGLCGGEPGARGAGRPAQPCGELAAQSGSAGRAPVDDPLAATGASAQVGHDVRSGHRPTRRTDVDVGATDDLGVVLEDSPAAVLVVDLGTRRVVHANDIAKQLAPGLRLPLGLDAWSDAAELRDPEGAELSETDHPLSRVARSESVAGQAVSAARRSAMGARREPLWMVAMSMTDAPMLDGHALVVLIPLRHSRVAALLEAEAPIDREAVTAEVSELVFGHELRDRALNSTALAVTVANALDAEQALVWVNPAFTATTGYTAEEAVGRNCRFLQGPETDAAGRRRLREAVEQGISVSVTLLNYRKDGTEFWNQVDLSPVRDPEDRIALHRDPDRRHAARRSRDRRSTRPGSRTGGSRRGRVRPQPGVVPHRGDEPTDRHPRRRGVNCPVAVVGGPVPGRLGPVAAQRPLRPDAADQSSPPRRAAETGRGPRHRPADWFRHASGLRPVLRSPPGPAPRLRRPRRPPGRGH
ncbi:PAS domain-containing protein [Nocardioides dongxiaopingii]|nr:PAS domain-containing protein [Nocardioides sp. S-1144]